MTLVNSYANGILGSCATMTPAQQTVLVDIFNALVNVTSVIDNGAEAAITRSAYNGILTRNSWLYFGGIGTLFAALAAAGSKRTVPWRHIIGENLSMVALLGLYEWMFFRTVVYQYKSISIAELDEMVATEFMNQCEPTPALGV